MEKIVNSGALQDAILSLETEQAEKWQQLKEQFSSSKSHLTPSGILNGSLVDMITSPYVINKTVGTAVGLASGYFLEKVVVGATTSLFRKLFGSVLRIAVTKIFSKRHGNAK
jgi:hypothetical protein